MMYVGIGIFALIAVLCVFAYFKVRDREKEWEQEEHRQGRD
jgi:heme/copper-type cytochrome/quinol oxidase subunit 2